MHFSYLPYVLPAHIALIVILGSLYPQATQDYVLYFATWNFGRTNLHSVTKVYRHDGLIERFDKGVTSLTCKRNSNFK